MQPRFAARLQMNDISTIMALEGYTVSHDGMWLHAPLDSEQIQDEPISPRVLRVRNCKQSRSELPVQVGEADDLDGKSVPIQLVSAVELKAH